MSSTPLIYAAMTDGDVVGLAGRAIWITLQIGGPILIVGLIVGLAVSILQAVTQIQEQTLVFIPKIIAIVAVLAIAGPWMMNVMLSFTTELFAQIPALTARR